MGYAPDVHAKLLLVRLLVLLSRHVALVRRNVQARACKRASGDASSSFLLGSTFDSKVFPRSDMSQPTITFFKAASNVQS